MGLPAPMRPKQSLDLPPAPPLSVEETIEQEFREFMGEQEQYEAQFHMAMNEFGRELSELGLKGRTHKVVMAARASDLESSLQKPQVPAHLRDRFEERNRKLTEPYRKKIERLADEQIRKDQNQRDLEGLADLHERGAIKGHPLEPLLDKLFEEKEQENGTS